MRDFNTKTALCCAFLFPLLAGGQNTVGLTSFDTESLEEGYMLFYPLEQGSVFLVNSCGQLVHQWEDTQYHPGNTVRFMENGDIVRTGLDPLSFSPYFNAGGAGQLVQRKDWDNNILWQYELSSDTARMHHDVEVLPNGNVLIIAWELKTIDEAWAMGMDTIGFGHGEVWPEMILEVEPVGADAGNIVWEWHSWDHMVQDFDALAANYAIVEQHPELIDMNVSLANGPDLYHLNSIDYNPDRDQIMVSSPFLNEIWIIDHSTTTAEAAAHSGGTSGRGGDLLYRWGNPSTYGLGDHSTRRLFFNHDAKWIGPGLSNDDPDRGKIMVFNNRLGPDYSSVDVIAPPVNDNGTYVQVPGSAFGPAACEKRYMTADSVSLFSSVMSSAQKLANGNVLICSSRQAWIFQLTPDTTVAWSYINPISGGFPLAQGADPSTSGFVFHAHWLLPSEPGLQGHDLDPIGYIEMEPNETFCNLTTGVVDLTPSTRIGLEQTLVAEVLPVTATEKLSYTILDGSGRWVGAGILPAGRSVIPVAQLAPGLYLLSTSGAGSKEAARFMVARP